ncbi:MAG: outer membrane lipoprotein chaperone LolA [Nitrospirota bacterium]|nr:outer membrane lipoprotein chaperone LolA [Nitrospirota bacterium]
MRSERGVRSAKCGVKASNTSFGLRIADCGIKSTAFTLLLVLTAVSVSIAETADDIVASIEKHYQAVNDLSGKVSQKNYLKSVNKTQKFEGTLSIKKPGKLRLEYTNGQIIVIDGKAGWFYSKKNEQAIRKTFEDFERVNVPVAFLLGAGNIRQDFTVSLAGPGPKSPVDLVPKKPGAAMKKLRVDIDAEGRINVLTVYDRNGNTSEVSFADVRENAGVEDAQFKFAVPKGTEVIEQ